MATHVPGGGWVSDQEWARRRTAAQQAGGRSPEQDRRVLAGQQRALSVHRPWAPQHRGVLLVHAGRA